LATGLLWGEARFDRGVHGVSREKCGLMAYAQRRELSGNRTLAIIVVAVIQFTLGYAIVTGLAYNVIKKASENLKTFDVEETPPPPEQPPPPPPKNVPDVPPPPVAMRPIVQTNVTPTPQIVTSRPSRSKAPTSPISAVRPTNRVRYVGNLSSNSS